MAKKSTSNKSLYKQSSETMSRAAKSPGTGTKSGGRSASGSPKVTRYPKSPK